MRPEFYVVYEGLYRDYLYDNTLHRAFFYNNPYRYRGDIGALPPELVKELIYETQRAIDNAAEGRDGYSVRPDAKYFLLVNFYEMVLRPIAAELQGRRDIGEQFDRGRMREDLRHDVELILRAAQERAGSRGGDGGRPREGNADEATREISGHNVIDAIGGVWDKIRYNEYLYWGRTDE